MRWVELVPWALFVASISIAHRAPIVALSLYMGALAVFLATDDGLGRRMVTLAAGAVGCAIFLVASRITRRRQKRQQ